MPAEVFSVEKPDQFLILTALETVLGFDNLLYISIEAKRVMPGEQAYVGGSAPCSRSACASCCSSSSSS